LEGEMNVLEKNDKKIKYIQKVIGDNSGDIYYEVGRNEITEIKEAYKSGHMANIIYYEIFKKGKHLIDLHEFTEVGYFNHADLEG
jgi:hypothetical protein